MSNANGNRYDMQTVLDAISGSGAIMSTIAKRLNCGWATARSYVQRWEETQQAYEDEEQTILDMAESTLYQAIRNNDVQAAKWVLSTKGKARGFSEKYEHEVTGAGGGPVEVKVNLVRSNQS